MAVTPPGLPSSTSSGAWWVALARGICQGLSTPLSEEASRHIPLGHHLEVLQHFVVRQAPTPHPAHRDCEHSAAGPVPTCLVESVSPGGMQGKLSWVNCALGWPAYHTPLTCRYQQILHRNLVYLATIADSNQNMQSLLPAVSAMGAGAAPTLPGTVGHCLRPPAREQRSEVLPGIAKVTNRE